MVLAGDVFYSRPVARRMLTYLRRCRVRGIEVLVGDPGRTGFPGHLMRPIKRYDVVDMGSRRPEVQAAVYALD
jgi:predicted nicotinamide N-methyase